MWFFVSLGKPQVSYSLGTEFNHNLVPPIFKLPNRQSFTNPTVSNEVTVPAAMGSRCNLGAEVSRAEVTSDALLSFSLRGKCTEPSKDCCIYWFATSTSRENYNTPTWTVFSGCFQPLWLSGSPAANSLGKTAKSKGRWGNAPDCLHKGWKNCHPLLKPSIVYSKSSTGATELLGRRYRHFPCTPLPISMTSIPCKRLHVF